MTLDRTLTSPRAGGGATGGPTFVLRVVHPPEAAGTVALDADKAWQVLGRGAGIDHPTVSREHLAIRRRGMVLEVEDRGSHNGTWLDGAKLEGDPAFLGNASVLRVGDTLAVVEPVEADGEGVDRDALPGDAPPMRALRAILGRVAAGSTHLLLLGETGTGKELAARELHRLRGRGPLVTFNCAGLSSQLADSQLFGHLKGAFTGAEAAHDGLFRRADGGTLFLDEVAELDPQVQAKLLRVLETGEVQPLGSDRITSVDVRVVAATQPDLPDLVADGRFRRDLYARLALATAVVPPLRERRGDLPMWIERLERRWIAEGGGAPLSWSPEAMQDAALDDWPDNLRGVDRVVYQLRLRHGGGATVTRDLLRAVLSPGAPRSGDETPETKLDKPTEAELVAALEANGGSVRATARHFGRDRRQIYRWMEAYGLR
ncbi:MAG: sigma 54-interacting transcriptional regulator [Sandaracinaceae bacterium]|nr:sigma 54-interacting transcriptional regulator [Sandaracinaceae bacterium]